MLALAWQLLAVAELVFLVIEGKIKADAACGSPRVAQLSNDADAVRTRRRQLRAMAAPSRTRDDAPSAKASAFASNLNALAAQEDAAARLGDSHR